MRSRRLTGVLVAALILSMGAGARLAWSEVHVGRYVALGDGLSAGFADGALYKEAQLGSYPSLLARQVRPGALPFEQPLMTDPGIPALLAVNRSEQPPRATLEPRGGLGSPVNLTLPRPYDNLSVPGAKVSDLLRASSDGSGFHDLVLRGLGSQLEQALLLEPDLVSLWAGSSDVLGAAISGIVLDGVTMTPTERFSADYNSIVQSLVAGGVEVGVVATVPRPTDLPYVHTLGTVATDLVTGLALEVDAAPVPLVGPDGPLGPGDFVLLSASPLLARGDGVSVALGGSGVPLPDQAVLSRSEALQINRRVAAYNQVIRRAAADVGFAVVDAQALFEDWRGHGVIIGGERLTTRYLTGGLFSLDGVHPSRLGHALLASAFIDAVNVASEADIAPLRPSQFSVGTGRGAFDEPHSQRVVFAARAFKNLRFGLGIPRTSRLVKLKQRALRRQQELENRRRRQRYELPAEPKLAALRSVLVVAAATAPVFAQSGL